MHAELVQNSTFYATVGGAITSIVVWALKNWQVADLPPEIAAAITTLIMAVLTHLIPDATQANAGNTAGAGSSPGTPVRGSTG